MHRYLAKCSPNRPKPTSVFMSGMAPERQRARASARVKLYERRHPKDGAAWVLWGLPE